ncbi:MAG: hypothetical protein M1826_000908 [Phylliscum demangeonii]|nr:MAG: hypothetical protein M1826_000908 [Phylliscum demangeonii]
MSAGIAGKTPWPSHVVERRVQNLAMLAKRTTDEESPSSPNDVKRGTNDRKGPVVYTSEQLDAYREEYNTAKRASVNLRSKVERAQDAGLEVSPDDLDELARLTTVTTQRRLVFTRARQGKPLDRRISLPRLDVASLLQDPYIQELAKSGVYSVEQLAEYKRRYLDAAVEFGSVRRKLADIAKVRKVTEFEQEGLAIAQRAYNHHKKVWDRVRANKPADYRVDPPKRSMDDLLGSAKLHAIARSSGYSVEEVAVQYRGYLDALSRYRAAQRLIAALKEKGGTLKPGEEDRFLEIDDDYHLQKTGWDRMTKGELIDPALPPPPRLGHLGKDVAALQQKGKADTTRPGPGQDASSVTYTAEQMATYHRAHLDALNKVRAFEKQLAAAGHPPTADDETHHAALHADRKEKTRIWNRVQRGKPVDRNASGRRPASVPKRAESHETRPRSPAPPSNTEADHPPMDQPLQMAAHRLLAPLFASTTRFLHGLDRQWRGLPWTRYRAHPRVKMVQPAESLRAEPAL